MPNSTPDRFIFDPDGVSQLNWEICRNIVEGIARGLCYLHEESGLGVIHCDIKPSHILLDSDLKPKIAGFGLAMIIQQGESESETTGFVGTFGYLDPVYVRTGHHSVKSDVYAFGVTILTIISRREPYGTGVEDSLIGHVMRSWRRLEAIDVIHEMLREEESEESISEMLRYIHIALLCLDENPENRPSLDEVLHWFSCASTLLPQPTIENTFLEEEDFNPSFSSSLYSVNSADVSPLSTR